MVSQWGHGGCGTVGIGRGSYMLGAVINLSEKIYLLLSEYFAADVMVFQLNANCKGMLEI